MSFQDIADLDCQVTTAIGGVDKKSGKKNPTTAEGYFIGTRKVTSPKSKTGYASLHVLQTKEGNLGIWGKTNLDQKMTAVNAGQMIRITFTGMVETKNNPMYKYRVQVDPSNSIEVNSTDTSSETGEGFSENGETDAGYSTEEAYEAEAELGDEEAPLDEIQPSRAAAPVRRAAAPDPARAAKVAALLNGRGGAKRTA